MAQVTKPTSSEVSRRPAVERMRGMFADVAPERKLVDELIAERRVEARAAETQRRERRR